MRMVAESSNDVRVQFITKALDAQHLNNADLQAARDAVAGIVTVQWSSCCGPGDHRCAQRHVVGEMECTST